jgi:hypothetical protein
VRRRRIISFDIIFGLYGDCHGGLYTHNFLAPSIRGPDPIRLRLTSRPGIAVRSRPPIRQPTAWLAAHGSPSSQSDLTGAQRPGPAMLAPAGFSLVEQVAQLAADILSRRQRAPAAVHLRQLPITRWSTRLTSRRPLQSRRSRSRPHRPARPHADAGPVPSSSSKAVCGEPWRLIAADHHPGLRRGRCPASSSSSPGMAANRLLHGLAGTQEWVRRFEMNGMSYRRPWEPVAHRSQILRPPCPGDAGAASRKPSLTFAQLTAAATERSPLRMPQIFPKMAASYPTVRRPC